ncbi:esterase-like activity of phytase family protein [Streptomyces sp. NPDC051684]|uniref:esterase-like activity of phytase family protein n=1 Tax=Streptomyces sp. NPDC051684 TaxID=3365670 RepID=UPI0037A1E12A
MPRSGTAIGRDGQNPRASARGACQKRVAKDDYEPDKQYAYRADDGLGLAELVAVSETRLLALERQYVVGLGNAVHVNDLSLAGASDVSGKGQLYSEPSDVYIDARELLDLKKCPAGSPGVVKSKGTQVNPLLENAEGMALGETLTSGPYKGRRHLLLVSDDNRNKKQTTRLYSFAVKL